MINLNGIIQSANEPVFLASNRSFRYGDGLFETIRVFNGRMPFAGRHWERLSAGMQLLRMEAPPFFSAAFFEKEISKLTQNHGNWRVRLSVWRSGSGLYTPETNLPAFLIEADPLPSALFDWNEKGLRPAIFRDARLPCRKGSPKAALPGFSNLKTCNAIPFVLAGVFKKEKNLDECILLNQRGRIACGSSSNIFIVTKGRLVTPPLSEGCVAGTMRETVIDLAKQKGWAVEELPVRRQDLQAADEVFFTNAIKGIQWAGSLDGVEKIYGNEVSCRLFSGLNELVIGH